MFKKIWKELNKCSDWDGFWNIKESDFSSNDLGVKFIESDDEGSNHK